VPSSPPKLPRSKPLRSKKRQTLKELQDLQQLAASIIMQPLTSGFQTNRTRPDGKKTAAVAETFVKPNDRLTSFERVEIYNKQYWFRLIDCLYDDYPGLLAILGRVKFNRLINSYIEEHPSRSFSLRNLGDRLEQHIIDHPEITGSKQQLAREMAAFQWAQTVAFDGPGKTPVTVDDLLGMKPEKLKLAMQEYITLLEMHWPLDDFTLALKRQQQTLRGEASNAVEAPSEKKIKKISVPRPERVFVAVHRLNNDLFYKRLEPEAYQILIELRSGQSLAAACETALAAADPEVDWSPKIQKWFRDWTAMGWFCKRAPAR
jgi:hypothetical protein